MSYAFSQELPFTRDVYERFCAALPDETPAGLVVRVATETEGGVRMFEVWESESDYQDFVRTAIQPIVTDGFFNGTGYEPPEQEPPRQMARVLDVWVGVTAANHRQQVLRDDPRP